MMMKQLERACAEKRPIEIIYINKGNSISQRTINVNALNDTYINAYCLIKKQPRIFKLDSILAASFITKKQKMHA
jgi:predicted DNA-binding transcriptional regulator YafY